jgi:hypothetical protein
VKHLIQLDSSIIVKYAKLMSQTLPSIVALAIDVLTISITIADG